VGVAGSVVRASVSMTAEWGGGIDLPGGLAACWRAPPVLLVSTASSLPFSPGRTSMARVARVDLPQRSVLKLLYAKAGFADAFAIDLPSNATGWLIALRDTLVAGFGLKTSSELRDDVATDRIDFFRVYDRRRHEIILGEDDHHLDFRLSVLVEESALCRRLVATTVVTFNHLGGRAYIAGIAPFHRLIVKSSLRRAERSGWPT